MMKLFLYMNLMLNMTMLTAKHPMFLSMILMMNITNTSLIMLIMTSDPLMPMMTFLIMVGGLMILFLYMVSMSSNKKFLKIKMKSMILMILAILVMFFIKSEMQTFNQIDFNHMFIKFATSYSIQMILFLIMYLLVVMIAITKISKFKNKSVRLH